MSVSLSVSWNSTRTSSPRRRLPPEDPREEIACVGRIDYIAVFGEFVSVSVLAPWNASLSQCGFAGRVRSH